MYRGVAVRIIKDRRLNQSIMQVVPISPYETSSVLYPNQRSYILYKLVPYNAATYTSST